MHIKNFLRSITLGALLVFPVVSNAQSQLMANDEAMAEMPVTTPENVESVKTETVVVDAPAKKVATKAPVTKPLSKKELRAAKKTARKARRTERKIKKAKKFLNSRVGKWLIKRSIKKAEKRKKRYLRKAAKAEKKGNKKLQEKYERKALSGNMKIGVILILVGLILSFLPVLNIIGWILIVVGLVFILLALL
ncbi:hypothetical protein [Microscilla marina]|uniref:Uncharacterized protein n=1 Tax=Microscilla marina ATCC 23134 TaxID=313606 RepID=A1ZNL1_MICM2|nr:hypothetical protein [Microscilla marina]EAY28122.1 hypothetical protein M23134_02232 [Microscilla marina ATCC 23134]